MGSGRVSVPPPESDRRAKGDACSTCHMPSTGSSNIAHASVTDHRILRRAVPSHPPPGLARGAVPLVTFATGPHAPPDLERDRDRDLGIALSRLLGKLPNPTDRELLGDLATERFGQPLNTWRGDVDVWIAASTAHAARGDLDAARKAAAAARRLAPESEAALAAEADTAFALGQFAAGVDATSKLIEINPTAADARVSRAFGFALQGDWASAEEDCRAALRIHPLHPQARLVRAVCRHHLGDTAGGTRPTPPRG